MLLVNVVSQPVGLLTSPLRSIAACQMGAAGGVGDVERAVLGEREPVGDEVLGAERVGGLAAGRRDRDRAGREAAVVAPTVVSVIKVAGLSYARRTRRFDRRPRG